jgi:hypothetical protein
VDRVEPLVWEYVSGVMKDPEGLRADIDRMIELEKGTRGGPGKEAGRWAEKLAEVDRKRARYQEMAAGDLITLDELRARLPELEETRENAERELATVRGQEERVRDMERDRDALIDSLETMAPEVLDSRPRRGSSGKSCCACRSPSGPTVPSRWAGQGRPRERPFAKRQRHHDERLHERETALVQENAREPRDSAVYVLRPDTITHVRTTFVAAFRPGLCRPLRRGL